MIRKRRSILLVEPNYKNKYPPIGLMKIANYHKMRGDKVVFYKGDLRDFLINIRVEKATKSLKRLHKSIDWESRKDFIRGYLKTRRNIHLEGVIDGMGIERKEKGKKILSEAFTYYPSNKWDRIYITTLFTFYWNITIETIQFFKKFVDKDRIYIGGVMASLLSTEIEEEVGIKPFSGLLDKAGLLDPDDSTIIDDLPLDYSILDEIEYKYPTQSAYFTFMTKGCTRKCAFCSVPKLEPVYKDKVEAIDKYADIKRNYGEQRNLLLMDNNVLASPKFNEIIDEIKAMGFYKGAMYNEPNQYEIAIRNLRNKLNDAGYERRVYDLLNSIRTRIPSDTIASFDSILNRYGLNDRSKIIKKNILKSYKELAPMYEKYRYKSKLTRYVDFNQGTDARYINEENMKLMSEIPIHPLRIAFDNIGIKNKYINAIEIAAKNGITVLSNYILYNFHDKPEDLYNRLKINIDLNQRLGIKIFSFPMKYIPLFGEEAKNRKFTGSHWEPKFVRAIQSVLNATKGIVAPGYDFFEMAFGKSEEEYMELLYMPEAYIINRRYFIDNGMIDQWRHDFAAIDELEQINIRAIIVQNDFKNIIEKTTDPRALRLLSHYTLIKGTNNVIDVGIRRLRRRYNALIRKDQAMNLTLTYDYENTQVSLVG